MFPVIARAAWMACALLLITSPLRSDVVLNPDQIFFDHVTRVSVDDHPTGRPHVPYPGANVRLWVTRIASDEVQWFHQSQPISGATDSELNLDGFTSENAGVYWAVVTRQGVTMESEYVVLNLASRQTVSLVDRTFTNQFAPEEQGWEYGLRRLRSNQQIGYTRFIGPLYFGGAGVIESDGSSHTSLYSWTYQDGNAGGLRAVLVDGTVLVNLPGSFLQRVHTDGTRTPLPYEGEVELFDGVWLLAPNDDLLHVQYNAFLRIAPNGQEVFVKRPQDFGLTHFSNLWPDRFDTDRYIVHGQVIHEDESFEDIAIVVDGNGTPLPDIAPMHLSEGRQLTAQPNGGWVEVTTSQVRRFFADGSWRDDREFGEWSHLYWHALADGYFYSYFPGAGFLRLDSDLKRDPDFFAVLPPDKLALGTIPMLGHDGKIYVTGDFLSVDDHETTSIARLNPEVHPEGVAPVVAIVETGAGPTANQPIEIKSTVVGNGPFTYEWSNLDRPDLSFPAASALVIEAYTAEVTGRYQLKVTGKHGVGYSELVDLRPPSTPFLRNLSGRGRITHPDQPLRAGFVVEPRVILHPTGPVHNVLIRGVGPTLADFNVADVLADPILRLRTPLGEAVSTNDDWAIASGRDALLINHLSPFPLIEGSLDAQLVESIETGIYIAEVATKSSNDAPGHALVEIYQLQSDTHATEMTNLSLRGRTGAEDTALTAGFVIEDPAGFGRSLRVLVRAVGPGLTPFGVPGVCPDPLLRIYNASGDLIASNDNWDEPENILMHDTTQAVGAFALQQDSADAALLLDLPAGAYTAQTIDTTGGEGEVLVEIYRVGAEDD